MRRAIRWVFNHLETDPRKVKNFYGRSNYETEIDAMEDEYEGLKRRFDVPAEAFEPPFEIVHR